jgi:hypothetical protein
MMPINAKRLLSIVVFLCFVFSTSAFASGAKRPDTPIDDESQTAPFIPTPTPAPTPDPPVIPPVTVQDKYDHIDQDKVVPPALLTKALSYYDANPSLIKNKRYMIVIDFSQHNSKKRFYLIDMESGEVERYLTAHGKNSDPDFDGYATVFSNTNSSLMSSLGYYLTAETYYGEHGYSLRLDGLSSTNSNARARAIVIHGASYVRDAALIGRSYGCPALEEDVSTQVIDMVKGGTLIYAGI